MQNSFREGDKEISLSSDKIKKAILELSYIIVSIDKIGSWYTDGDLDQCAREVLRYIDKSDVLDRLALLRALLDIAYDKVDNLDDPLYEEAENQMCWEKPGDYSTEKWLKDEDVFEDSQQE